MSSATALGALQKHVWAGSVPLEITLSPVDCRAYDETDPYLVLVPRLSYLPFLLPRLHRFFRQSLIHPDTTFQDAWLSYDGLPLKWHYPIGLLADLHSGIEAVDGESDPGASPAEQSGVPGLPWKLKLHYSEFPDEQLFQVDLDGKVLLDAFINNVKEADYIRNGSAKAVMSLGKADSDSLWRAVETHDLALFKTIHDKLMNPTGQSLRHVPIKIYLPSPPLPEASDAPNSRPDTKPVRSTPAASSHVSRDPTTDKQSSPTPASFRVIQPLVPLFDAAGQPNTLGTTLHDLMPIVFPSRRTPVLATTVLHGAVVPLTARLDELGFGAAYADGFLHVVVVPVA